VSERGDQWNGGGISTVYQPPSYQSGFPLPVNLDTGKPGRGVPDVVGDADPASGYRITVDGETIVVGGTSAALYSLAAGGNTEYFREITKGNNKPAGSSLGYDAGPGWNACSGLGVMRGAALFATLTGSAGTAVTDVASK
jgi:kumamolisin